MLLEKKALSAEMIDAQAALELPDREMMLVTVVITNLLNGNTVQIPISDVNVGAAICAAVIASPAPLDCEVTQS